MTYSDRDQLCVYILVIFFVPQAARLSGVDHTFSVERCQMGTIRRGQHHRHDVALSIRRGQYHRHDVAMTAGCAGRSERPHAFVRRSREAMKNLQNHGHFCVYDGH